MNTPTNDREDHDDSHSPLKSLKPRAPQLDWDAIHAARTEDLAATTAIRPTPAAARPRIGPAVAWWSGLAAGAAITFFTMQWLVLNDLRTKLDRLEQTAQRSTSEPAKLPSSHTSKPSSLAHAVDFQELFDRTQLTVGSVRGNANRLIHTHASASDSERASPDANMPSDSKRDVAPVRADGQFPPEAPLSNHWLLLKELKQAVH